MHSLALEYGSLARDKDQEEFLRQINERVHRAVLKAHAKVVENTPVDEGDLRRSITVERLSDNEWVIGSNSDIALFLEEGTGIYGPMKKPITPVNAKALSWIDQNGERVFAKSVKGIKPFRMFHKGAMQLEQELKEVFR